MEKQDLRKRQKELRSLIGDRFTLSKAITQKAIEYIEQYNLNHISCYYPLATEVDTRPLIEYCFQKSKDVCIPHISLAGEMKMLRLSSFSELTPSTFGLQQIKQEISDQNDREVKPSDIEVVFVPLLAFDLKNNRLGYGKGYYDRFFAICSSRIKKIGLAYSEQEVEKVPIDSHDIKLDIIITEKS